MTRTRSGALKRRSYFGNGGLVRNLAGAVASGYNMYKRRRTGQNNNNGNGKKLNTTGFITNQYDVKAQYRRRRMPYRKRKRWGRFVRKVRACTNKDFASQYQVLRSRGTSSSVADGQLSFSAGVYGQNGTPSAALDMGSNDLSQLNTLSGDTGLNNTFIMKSAVLDVEMVNTGEASCTIDAYEIICRKDINSQGAVVSGPNDLFIEGFAAQNTLGGNSSLSAAIPGATPFQNSLFCSHFTILKKTRILLSAGQTTHVSLRDAKDRVYKSEQISRAIIQRGWYHGFLFICQGVTTDSQFSAASEISFTAIRYYNYLQKEVNTIAAGYTNPP